MNKKVIVILASCLVIGIGIISTYLITNMANAATRVYVDPDKVAGSIGQDVTVNISILNVDNLYAWECKLGWNMTILEFVNVTEGTFLKNAGSTFFTDALNETFGHVVIDCTLLGNVEGVSENGVLAAIQFHVKNEGSCDLVLYDTKLLDASERVITHTVNGGYFSTNP
jgi:Cohesin domain